MSEKKEKRRALRAAVNIPTAVLSVGQPAMKLHENLARVYSRVEPDETMVGRSFEGAIRDLSTNGAFIAGEALPLLSRVAFSFPLEGFGQVEVLAWSLWQRAEDCQLPRPDGTMMALPRGFGVLFEAVPLDARIAIRELVSSRR